MSLQKCHCGWTKVTTYRGLRIHQGRMGCTPRDGKMTENEQPNIRETELNQNEGITSKKVDGFCTGMPDYKFPNLAQNKIIN